MTCNTSARFKRAGLPRWQPWFSTSPMAWSACTPSAGVHFPRTVASYVYICTLRYAHLLHVSLPAVSTASVRACLYWWTTFALQRCRPLRARMSCCVRGMYHARSASLGLSQAPSAAKANSGLASARRKSGRPWSSTWWRATYTTRRQLRLSCSSYIYIYIYV